MILTNYENIPLVLAVWLAANDGYDLKPAPHVVSATSLMKPTKSLILEQRVAASKTEDLVMDVSDLIPARLGTAVHTAAEVSWLYSREHGLKNLGIPQHVIDKIRINPDTPGDNPDLDLYMEQRANKAVGKWIISGKFDVVEGGRVKDIKTTSTYNWTEGSNDEKYKLQGSIYRWLNPEIIKDDYIDILMIFTDWSALKALADKRYPKSRIMVRSIPLLSIADTERWVKQRLDLLDRFIDAPQSDMPECTPKELWMQPPKYAYYKDPKGKRATRVYDNPQEANAHRAREGKGKVVERPSEPKYCRYCAGRPMCLQAEGYVARGLLKL
jgi:hypothetical protein